MMEAEFSMRGIKFWLVDVSQRFSTTLTIAECIPWKKRGGQAMFSIEEGMASVDSVLAAISQSPDVISVERLSAEENQVKASVAMRECLWIWKIVDCGCFLERAWSEGDGEFNLKILSGNEGSLPRLIKSLSTKGVEVEIRKMAQITSQNLVTAKQEEVLRIALERGFFDYPRRIKLKELAKLCNMNIATVDETIKRGQRNVVKEYFRDR
ncbi:MAG: HTH DNA binding domain protein [Methanomassiliicoccales archaeon PtaU1.Bin124]|nr:MAG: HTH DNA binding domain protein [Methanomassiliicoccales archaeon PtaU1.Bin124]